MRFLLAMTVAVVLASALAHAEVVFFEDWEAGMERWSDAYYVEPYARLSDEQNATPGGSFSLKTAGTTVNYTNSVDYNLPMETAQNWYVEFNFFDTGATREFIQIRSYDGGGMRGKELQQICFGVYNYNVDTSVYNIRVRYGGAGWTNTTISRTNNTWHTMRVEQDFDGVLKFLIDGEPAFETTTTAIHGITTLRVGSAVGNGGNGAYYDDIKIGIVPEPAAVLMLLAGVPMLLRRRR
jgi:hypothetical protein